MHLECQQIKSKEIITLVILSCIFVDFKSFLIKIAILCFDFHYKLLSHIFVDFTAFLIKTAIYLFGLCSFPICDYSIGDVLKHIFFPILDCKDGEEVGAGI